MNYHEHIGALRMAVPYIASYKNAVFVVKLGGALCRPGRVLTHLVDQLTVLHQLGVKIIVVHGGGEQATELGRKLGIEPNIVAGRRITDAATLEVVKMAFRGTVNTDLIAAFRRSAVPAMGLTGIDAGLVVAARRPRTKISDPSTGQEQEIDFGFVGDIVNVDDRLLSHLLEGGVIPVIGSLAADENGSIYNINADTTAARIALAVNAAKYFLVTNVDGVMRDTGDARTLQSYLSVDELDSLVASGAIHGGMLPKLAACRDALLGGISRVHIVNGTKTDTLLAEVFTNEGCGTLLVRDSSEAIGAPAGAVEAVEPEEAKESAS